MKKQWIVWFFVIGVIGIVLFAFNYPGGQEGISLSEIFSEEKIERMPEVEYEFVESDTDATPVSPQASTKLDSKTSSLESQPIASEPLTKNLEERPSGPLPGEDDAIPNFSKVAYTIQVASHKDKQKAESLLKDLREAGHPAYLVSRDLGEKGLFYRIYVGTFSTKTEADELLTKIKNQYKDSFIISPMTSKSE